MGSVGINRGKKLPVLLILHGVHKKAKVADNDTPVLISLLHGAGSSLHLLHCVAGFFLSLLQAWSFAAKVASKAGENGPRALVWQNFVLLSR